MYVYLDIVEQFACEMCGQCCRNEWMVTLDESSYRRNAALFASTNRQGEFNEAFVVLENPTSIGEYAYIAKQPSGDCWFLHQSNFCRLHREAGHSHLDTVCQTFPRYPMGTARGVEITLSFSCPAVMKRASREQPLAIIRSERKPIELCHDNYTVEVYPKQQSPWDPLYYYFEIEQHCIDLLQCRAMSLDHRFALLDTTVKQICAAKAYDQLGQNLNKIFYTNYELLDAKAAEMQQEQTDMADIIAENFFVNLIFKKVLYTYGLLPGAQLMTKLWHGLKHTQTSKLKSQERVAQTREAIMEMEFQYCHQRERLFR